MTIYNVTGLCQVLFKAIFFYFEKFEQNYNHEKFVVENLPYEEVLSKKRIRANINLNRKSYKHLQG